jgi:hypothetical protein
MKVDALASSMLLYAVTVFVQLTSVGGSSSDANPYTAHQDMTWAVMSNKLSNPSKQAEYDAFMEACRASAEGMAETYCNHDESFRIQMNSEQPRSVRIVRWNGLVDRQCADSPLSASLCRVFVATVQVRNYTETGFLKIKAPEAVFSLVKEFWENNKDEQTVEWKHPSSYHNTWDAPTTIIRVDNTSLKGGGPQLYAAIANAARDAMEVSVFRRDQVGAE